MLLSHLYLLLRHKGSSCLHPLLLLELECFLSLKLIYCFLNLRLNDLAVEILVESVLVLVLVLDVASLVVIAPPDMARR
jgi:hypothetical protein